MATPQANLADVRLPPDFHRFWAAETIALFGAQITILALPLTAINTLSATPLQIGFLSACLSAPHLLLSLSAGVLIDRVRKRPLMLASNVARTLLLLPIPLLAAGDWLNMRTLYPIAFGLGIFNLLFQLAYQSYLPSIVAPHSLVAANGKLGASYSAAEIAGPGVAAMLIRFASAPYAILATCIFYGGAALLIARIRTAEPFPNRQRCKFVSEVREGFRETFDRPLLRRLVGYAASYNFARHMFDTVSIIYMVRSLGFDSRMLATVLACSGAGALIAAGLTTKIVLRLGEVRMIAFGISSGCIPFVVLPFSPTGPSGLLLFAAVFFLTGFGVTVSNIAAIAIRQATTRHEILGRVTASFRFCAWGVMPFGSLLGGVLAAKDIYWAFVVSCCAMLAVVVWATMVLGLRRSAICSPAPHISN